MRSLLLTTAACAAFLPASAFAQSADDPDTLADVIVTATRLPAIVQDTPGARVIDRETIDRRGAVFAADILADLPGLSIVRSGAFGGLAQVRIRGATPGKTLVLIDGVPVNDAAEINGAYDFSGLELADIERIEVLSGPQSSLWGSDAIGGVIAFSTREIDGFAADAEAGSFDTARGRLAGGVSTERYGFGAWVSRFETDGISAADEADGNPEADGFRTTAVGAKGRLALTRDAQIDGSVRHTDAEGDLDGFPPPFFGLADTLDTYDSEQWSGFGRLRLNALGLKHQFSVSGSDISRETVSSFPSTFEADRQVYRWQADGSASGVDFALGAEREETSGSISTGRVADLDRTSGFVTGRIEPSDRLSVTGALRYDDTDLGGELTGRLSAAYELGGGFVLSGAYGTGFKAPSISQALCDFCYGVPVFPALDPEKADGVEAALGWRSADSRIEGRVTVYRLDIEDQIAPFYGSGFSSFYYVNIDETRTDGVEVEGRAQLGGGFDVSLAYAWTDARNEATGARLLRVPENSGSVTVGWTGEQLSGALTVRAEDDQDDAGGVREGFVTANLNAAYALTDRVTLTARVENLAGERYQQVLGYGEPGRSGYVGVRLRY